MFAEDGPPHPPYGSNGAVEVWSASLGQWLQGSVIKVDDKSVVHVKYGPDGREKLLAVQEVPQAIRPIYAEGDSVEVFSSSLNAWVPGIVLEVGAGGEALVEYGGGTPDLPEARSKTLQAEEKVGALRLAYAADERIEVWSASLKKWFAGSVLSVHGQEGVRVTYGGGLPDLPKAREKDLARTELATLLRPLLLSQEAQASRAVTYSKGDSVEIWSESRGQWMPGVVEDTASDGSVKVAYGLRSKRLVRKEVAVFLRPAGEQFDVSECSCLGALSDQFRALDKDGSGAITAAELARRWAAAAQAKAKRPLSDGEKRLIATGVQNRLETLDIDKDGEVSMDEWLHQALLDKHPPGPAACDAIAARIRERGLGKLRSIVRLWSEIDKDGNGLLNRSEIESISRNKSEAAQVLKRMDASGSGSVSYAEWCAHELGLEFQEVELYYYDISEGVAKYLAPVLVWRRFEGVWHTGVVVYGREYYYGGGVFADPPGETCFGAPTKTMKLGLTLRTQDELEIMCEEGGSLSDEFTEENYDFLEHNCNAFSDAVVQFLLGRHIPEEVRKQPAAAMSSPVVKVVRPLLNRWLGNLDGTRADGGGDGGAVKSLGRHGGHGAARPATHLADAARQDTVLYEAPGSLQPVVAHVLKKHKDGSLDLCWFDATGKRETATRVEKNDTRPLQANNEDTNAKAVYLAALLALDKDETRQGDEATMRAALSQGLRRQSTLASTTLSCGKGHPMLRLVGQVGQRGKGASCNECGRNELGASTPYYMHCNKCVFDLCPSCAERQHAAGAARTVLAGALAV